MWLSLYRCIGEGHVVVVVAYKRIGISPLTILRDESLALSEQQRYGIHVDGVHVYSKLAQQKRRD
jgi:hypothetical protein